MKIEYKLSIDDYIALHYYIGEYKTRKERSGKRWQPFAPILLLLLVSLAWLFLVGPFWVIVVDSIMVLFLVANIWTTSNSYIRHRLEKAVRKLYSNEFFDRAKPVTVDITTGGIHAVTESSDGFYTWDVLEEAELFETHIFISFKGAPQAIIIPERAFADTEQRDRFITEAGSYLHQQNGQFQDLPQSE